MRRVLPPPPPSPTPPQCAPPAPTAPNAARDGAESRLRQRRLRRRVSTVLDELAAREHHYRDLPLGPRLVVVVRGPGLGHQRPQASALLALGLTRAHRDLLVLDLDRRVGIGGEVLKPAGIRRCATLGRHDDPA